MEPGVQAVGRMKFLCDGMLVKLCRCLRAAGYDAEVAEQDEHDGALLARAITEDRLLLTCDRELGQRGAARGRVVVLPSNGLDDAVRALGRALPIDWFLDPFRRCLLDNTPLRPASADELGRLPTRAREVGDKDVFVCPRCDRIYWPGSHVRRMRQRLSRWQSAARVEGF